MINKKTKIKSWQVLQTHDLTFFQIPYQECVCTYVCTYLQHENCSRQIFAWHKTNTLIARS